jgi:hypothetical protein
MNAAEAKPRRELTIDDLLAATSQYLRPTDVQARGREDSRGGREALRCVEGG